jgi:hypothetical protein
MRPLISRSQAGQDVFVYQQLIKPFDDYQGTFLDIGCGFPIEINNTYALEQRGWRGLLVDLNSEFVEMCRQQRSNPVLQQDATTVDWGAVCDMHNLGRNIDYLSLDIDDELDKPSKVVITLQNLLGAGFSFRIITLEHDRYHLGDSVRNTTREMLLSAGYTLSRPDVTHDGLEYEDWWTKNV